MRFSIRRKIFFGLIGIVIPFVVLINFIINELLNNIAHNEILHGLENSVLTYHRYDETLKELMLTQASTMAQSAHLKATLSIPGVDSETIYYSGEDLKDIAATELQLIVSDEGELLADFNNKFTSRTDLKAMPGIELGLYGEAFYGVWEYQQVFYRVVIVPSIVGEQIVGLIVLGNRLDSSESIQLLTDVTAANVIHLLNGHVFSTKTKTGSDNNLPHLLALSSENEQVLGYKEGVALSEVSIAGVPYYKAIIPYKNVVGKMILYRSFDLMTSSVEPIRQLVLYVSVIIILLGTLLSFRIASLISKPIHKLTQAARQFGNGNLELRIDPSSSDEVGELTNAFNQMADHIVSNRQQLLESIDAAEAASRAKSIFLATMSHEIRTPLNGVLGMTDLLIGSQLDERQQRFVNVINQSGNNLLDIINNILDFSKIEAGKMELSQSEFSLRQFIEEISNVFASTVQHKNLEFVCNLPPNTSLLVRSDECKLRQVLVNLVSNAVKFTQEGYIELKVSITKQLDAKAKIRFEVKDTGMGIESDKMNHIFQSFTQADGSTTRQFGGTGLGLAIARQLVELMGGTIGVNSEIGVGTSFYFELIVDAMTLPDNDRQQYLHALKGKTALIVDDVSTNREILVQQLASWKMTTKQAESGQDALDILHHAEIDKHPIDVALLDYNMPGMDGIELAHAIKNQKISKQIPIALFSCGQDIDLENISRLTDIDFCLPKPVSQSDLFTTLVSMVVENSSDETLRVIDNKKTISGDNPKLNAHVMIVEDTAVNQEVLAIMLDSLGCSYSIACDGLEAINIFNREKVDIILMDCLMPNMDGFDATKKIRELEKHANLSPIPIIAVTANAIDGDKQKCLDSGMSDYLTKPFSQHVLRDILVKWLNKQSLDYIIEPNIKETKHALSSIEDVDSGFSTILDRIKTTDLLDETVLQQFKQFQKPGQEDITVILKHAFMKDSSMHMGNLLKAFERSEAESLYKAAHALKSGSLNLGAKRLALICHTIEKIGRTGVTATAEPLIELIESVYPATLEQLDIEHIEAEV